MRKQFSLLWANIICLMAVNMLAGCKLHGQVASNDFYIVPAESELTVAAPGILSNDTSVPGYLATVVSGPANGSLTLNGDGAFSYTPTNNFTGVDGFTYQAK